MSPSANRHSGYSRKAQYGTFFAIAAAVVGALIGLALLIVSLNNPGAFAEARSVAADVAEPGGQAVATVRADGRGVFAIVGGYIQAGSQNARLTRELAEAKTRLVEAQAIAHENARLKALLNLQEEDYRPVAYTRLTASTPSSTRRFATIGVGASAGVAVGMPVRSPLGILGRVLHVGQTSSLVLLITDTQSVVPARRASDGTPAFIQGAGDGTVSIRLLNLGINPLKKGDVFVTSGSGGLYRPNMAIAMVTALTRDGATGRVLSDPGAADYVVVENVWNTAVPPPLPTASEP